MGGGCGVARAAAGAVVCGHHLGWVQDVPCRPVAALRGSIETPDPNFGLQFGRMVVLFLLDFDPFWVVVAVESID